MTRITREEWVTALAADPGDENTVSHQQAEMVRIVDALPLVAYVRSGGQTGADRGGLDAARMGASPLYDFVDEQDVRETIWRIARPAAVEAFRMMLSYVPCAYIADGHHRAASAARVCQEMRAARDGSPTDDACDYLLCVLFPASQLTIRPYHRVIRDAGGLSEDGLVSALEGAGFCVGARQDAPVMPPSP